MMVRTGLGGWQRSIMSMSFEFSRNLVPVYAWKCPMMIGMPIRPEGWGTISRARAARMTADTANEAVPALTNRGEDWDHRGTEFCYELYHVMKSTFDDRYPKLGATVGQPTP